MKKVNVEDILKKNPQLNLDRIAELLAFSQAVADSGLDVTPVYRVSPPLGELVPQSAQRRFVGQQKR